MGSAHQNESGWSQVVADAVAKTLVLCHEDTPIEQFAMRVKHRMREQGCLVAYEDAKYAMPVDADMSADFACFSYVHPYEFDVSCKLGLNLMTEDKTRLLLLSLGDQQPLASIAVRYLQQLTQHLGSDN